MAAFEAWLVFLILVVNVVGELQRKRTLAGSRGFLAATRLSCTRVILISGYMGSEAYKMTNKSKFIDSDESMQAFRQNRTMMIALMPLLMAYFARLEFHASFLPRDAL